MRITSGGRRRITPLGLIDGLFRDRDSPLSNFDDLQRRPPTLENLHCSQPLDAPGI
jgi:hypothetical protein